jgi:hypothetical protein
MPSTDRELELKAKDIDGSDYLTAGCVLIHLASPAGSQTAVYANGLIKQVTFSTMSSQNRTTFTFTDGAELKTEICNREVVRIQA